MISRQLKFLVFLMFFFLAPPLYADYIITEKGDVGDLNWWSDQVLTNRNTLYILGHMKNVSNEKVYKLYIVDSVTNVQSDIALTWEDDSPVTVPQNLIGLSGSDAILLHWWESDYYSAGIGAEVTGSLNIATGKVTKWQANPAPAHDAAAIEKSGIIADIKTFFSGGSYAKNGNSLLIQGIDKAGNAKLYNYNIGTKLTESANITALHSNTIGFSTSNNTIHVLWREKLLDNSYACKYGNMNSDGTIENTSTFPELNIYSRSYQHGDIITLSGRDFSDQKKLYTYNTVTGETSSSPFIDQTIQYDIYSINEAGEIITLWWDSVTQKEKYGVISNNSTVTLTGGAIVNEDVGTVAITATLANASSELVTIRLVYNGNGNDTAFSPADYSGETSIVIPAGLTIGTATVSISDDNLYEPGDGETLTISISDVVNGTESGVQVVAITIKENDNDGNGLPDVWEDENNVDDPNADPDNDGLTNLEEMQHETNPNNPDTDGDGYIDGLATGVLPRPVEVWVDDDWDGFALTQNVDGHIIGLNAFSTIQMAINIAAENAVIHVSEGIYTENIIWDKNLVISGAGAVETIVDGNGVGSVFNISNLSGSSLEALTIMNGNGQYGAGLYITDSEITISNCVFTQNTAVQSGGGVYTHNSTLKIENSIFDANTAKLLGGGLSSHSTSLTIQNCLFSYNVCNNLGGGVYAYNSFVDITGSTFTENSGSFNGGGIYAMSTLLEISGSISWNNSPNEIQNTANIGNIEYSDIMGGYEGEGNINEDPIFADSETSDFSLSANSPCIGAGNPDVVGDDYTQADLVGNPRFSCSKIDMGAYELPDPICSNSKVSQTEDKSSGGGGCFIETVFCR